MARLEFAILQYVGGRGRACKKCGEASEGVRVVLQRDDKQLLWRLQARVKENLGNELFGPEENRRKAVEWAIEKAFSDLIKEFKDETIRIV